LARKIKEITLSADAKRDAGKTFVITEMPALKAEKWALRAFLALIRAGIEIPEQTQALGMAGIASLSFQALQGLSFDDVEPLLEEMMDCIKLRTSSSFERKLADGDIEEVSTLFNLRKEVFQLHVDFSSGGVPSA